MSLLVVSLKGDREKKKNEPAYGFIDRRLKKIEQACGLIDRRQIKEKMNLLVRTVFRRRQRIDRE